ncbi:DNA packing UL15-like protein [Marmot herpesvirus 1]|nr:DNA packing UL15-like protein [Marmot herpesvirus 1]
MLQKDAKLIFISSVNSGDQSTSFLLNLKNAKERLLNVVNYVCNEHREEFELQDSMVSCPCYRLYIPTFITINETIKTTTNLFLEGAFTTELMGDTGSINNGPAPRVINISAQTQFDLCRTDTLTQEFCSNVEPILYVYIDPAYTNNHEASGTGISALMRLKAASQKGFLLGIEHYFLKDLTGAATLKIASCALTLIKAIYLQHPIINEVRVAVEGNSNQDSGVAISTFLNETCPIPISFCHYTDRQSMMQWPIYMLGTEKCAAFEKFIHAMNSGLISASQTIVSNTIKLNYDPVVYLLDQIKAIKVLPLKDGGYTFSAKQRTMSDDVLVATIMAYYMLTQDNHIFKTLTRK